MGYNYVEYEYCVFLEHVLANACDKCMYNFM